jgi:pimeloyl-ACP methyl ester carboxylesterase
MKRLLRILLRILFAFVAIVVVLLAAGYAYESTSEALDARRFGPPGEMIDIGGYRLNIVCKGDASGPTVVIEAGSGVGVVGYAAAQDAIATFARACSYDRAGLGWSEAAPSPRTFEEMARELNALLEGANIPGPYVLVAHSFGGFVARAFAHEYRSKTVGLALIETGNEELAFDPVAIEAFARSQQVNAVAAVLHRFGVVRLVPALQGPFANAPAEVKARILRPGIFRAIAREGAALAAIPGSRRHLGGLGTLDDLPLIVVVRGLPDFGDNTSFEESWRQGNRRLAELSTNSVVVVAEKSGHMVHVDQPEIYVDAVRRVVRAASDGSRVSEVEQQLD